MSSDNTGNSPAGDPRWKGNDSITGGESMIKSKYMINVGREGLLQVEVGHSM